MSNPNIPKPTDAELSILRVLWCKGPSTVRQVLDELNRIRSTGYTTVLKLLQIMADKQLVTRDESNRTHVYRARYSEADTQQQLAADLLERAFGGSRVQFFNALIDDNHLTQAEFEKLRREILELRQQEENHV